MDWDRRYLIGDIPWESIVELDQHFGPVFGPIDEKHPRRSFPGRESREIIRLLRKS
jgi:hypothetical protein